jgi:hypothetical protein
VSGWKFCYEVNSDEKEVNSDGNSAMKSILNDVHKNSRPFIVFINCEYSKRFGCDSYAKNRIKVVKAHFKKWEHECENQTW